jgi:hypothetical protein
VNDTGTDAGEPVWHAELHFGRRDPIRRGAAPSGNPRRLQVTREIPPYGGQIATDGCLLGETRETRETRPALFYAGEHLFAPRGGTNKCSPA